MGGIGDELTFPPECFIQPRQHRVKSGDQSPHLLLHKDLEKLMWERRGVSQRLQSFNLSGGGVFAKPLGLHRGAF